VVGALLITAVLLRHPPATPAPESQPAIELATPVS
jgi:hypothetical protein